MLLISRDSAAPVATHAGHSVSSLAPGAVAGADLRGLAGLPQRGVSKAKLCRKRSFDLYNTRGMNLHGDACEPVPE
jgi:hypothetical protein